MNKIILIVAMILASSSLVYAKEGTCWELAKIIVYSNGEQAHGTKTAVVSKTKERPKKEYLFTEALGDLGSSQILFPKLRISPEAKEFLYKMLQKEEGRNFVLKLLETLQLVSNNPTNYNYMGFRNWLSITGMSDEIKRAVNYKIIFQNAYQKTINYIFKNNNNVKNAAINYSESDATDRLAELVNNLLSTYHNNEVENPKTLEIIIFRAREILEDNVQFPTENMKTKAIDDLLNSIKITGQFSPIPNNLFTRILDFVPYYSTVMNHLQNIGRLLTGGATATFEQEIGSVTSRGFKEISKAKRRIRLEANKSLKAGSIEFLKTYVGDAKEPLEAASFIEDLTIAYPEVFLMRNANVTRSAGSQIQAGAYGPGSRELYLVLNRVKFTLALINNDQKYFPNLSEEVFERLRHSFLQNNSLLDKEGNVDLIKLDSIISFLVADIVGRGENYIIEEIEKIHHFKKRFGGDFEKSAVEIINIYPFSSQSLANLSREDFFLYLKAFDHLRKINLGQVPYLEASPYSFWIMKGADPRLISAMMARYKLTLAAVPIKPDTSFLWSDELINRIQNMEDILIGLSDEEKPDLLQKYWDYATQMAKGFQIQGFYKKSPVDRASLRLALMTRLNDSDSLNTTFNLIVRKIQSSQRMIDFLTKFPFVPYHFPDTFVEIHKMQKMIHGQSELALENAIDIWIGWIKKAIDEASKKPLTQSLSNMGPEEIGLEIQKHGEFRIYFTELKEFVATKNAQLKNVIQSNNDVKVKIESLNERLSTVKNAISADELTEIERTKLLIEQTSIEDELKKMHLNSNAQTIIDEINNVSFEFFSVERGMSIELN